MLGSNNQLQRACSYRVTQVCGKKWEPQLEQSSVVTLAVVDEDLEEVGVRRSKSPNQSSCLLSADCPRSKAQSGEREISKPCIGSTEHAVEKALLEFPGEAGMELLQALVGIAAA